MKKDIEEFKDVQLLVRSFYNKVLNDDVLAHFFAYAKDHNWQEHLSTLDSFWNNVLFYKGGYVGNPLELHKRLHYFKHLHHSNFDRWMQLFTQTVDDLFEGEKAALAKQRALSIATIMQLNILPKNTTKNHLKSE